MARMIPKVTRETRTQRAQRLQRALFSLRSSRSSRSLAVVAFVLAATTAYAHDVERTQVLLSFARDGSFTLDVSNDPNWLKLRLPRYNGPFADRVVLFVDGHEIRPSSVEFIGGETLATHRLRGRFPADAK